MEWYGLVGDYILELRVKAVKEGMIGGDKAGFVAVATGKILRHDDGGFPLSVRDKEDLGVIVGEIAVFDGLGDEWPKDKSLVGGLEVKNDVEGSHKPLLTDEEDSPQELFGDREGCHADVGGAGLVKDPAQDVGHLQGIAEIYLSASAVQRLENVGYRSRTDHCSSPASAIFLRRLTVGESISAYA